MRRPPPRGLRRPPPLSQTAAVGSAPPRLPDARNVGDAPGGETIEPDVLLVPRDPQALDAFVTAVSTPGSPFYGDYLATGEFRGRFGPTQATIDAVRAALRSAGLTPGTPSRSGLFIPVTTTVAEAEAALHTQIASYRLPSGETGLAATSAPRLARAIAPDVQAIVGLDTRTRPRPQVVKAGVRSGAIETSGSSAAALPSGWSGPEACSGIADFAQREGVYTFGQIADAYDFGSFYGAGNAGAGATVALVEFEPYLPGDIANFQECYRTDTSITNVTIGRGPGTGPGEGEAALDIQVLIGLAPEADIVVYSADNGTSNADMYSTIADANVAQVVSTSWGNCEDELDQSDVLAEAAIFQQMASQGQTVLAAAGDDGSTDCWSRDTPTLTELNVDDPGSQPNVTSVGGTTLVQPTDPPVEHVWNDGVASLNGAGGGGQSENWPMPAYQSGPGVIGPFTNGTACDFVYVNCRQVPDLSALGDPDTGYVIAYNGGVMTVGGTSAATPLWASMTALTTQSPQCQARGGRVGLLNPALYQLAGSTASPFNDVTVGDNDYLGTNNGLFPAAPGYDMASGLGTPIGRLVQSGLCGGIAAPSVTSAATAAFTVGQAGSFTVTTTGAPAPRLTVAGTLPAGVTFTDAGNGSATIAGTPAAGSAGTYALTVGAANGIAPAGTQSFTLTVAPAPQAILPPPAPPARAGLPQATASTRVRLGTLPQRVFTVASSGRTRLLLSCPKVAGGCTAGVTLSARVGRRGGKRSRTLVLAKTRPQPLSAGRTRTVVVNVSRAGRRAILAARARRLRTTLTLSARFANGTTTTTTTSVVLRMGAVR
ncbi:protease pro-enzyme activation domain-containing protein [Conexibacter sp. CPCC 206217]|uniref:protease pro-enzyme activation domain-containing protein n=1 Tax=Conexibacter sp. CPCC 206217 TaxID=3064574 RepID=UPI002729CB5E|nr:protease pro-enzyme activation domain-containing protein [Conexibacter sp. CPCC 206217]